MWTLITSDLYYPPDPVEEDRQGGGDERKHRPAGKAPRGGGGDGAVGKNQDDHELAAVDKVAAQGVNLFPLLVISGEGGVLQGLGDELDGREQDVYTPGDYRDGEKIALRAVPVHGAGGVVVHRQLLRQTPPGGGDVDRRAGED